MKKPSVPASEPGLSPGLRRYLYFTAALTGSAVMIVEILGAKMLSPYVGTSHFVWTAQIAVTLVALSAGYYVGGRLVDRSPRLGRLYWCILSAAFYLALTVAACRPVTYWCLEVGGKYSLAIGSLLASALLFFVPLALLAMVGPFVVRVLASAVTSVGGTMGRLTAISTLGSVAGTILIGYVLIPFLPNSVTMWLTALGLVLGCAGYFAGWGRKSSSLTPVWLVIATAVAAGYAGVRAEQARPAHSREVFRGNSNFGLLQVIDSPDGATRYYLNDYLYQNTYDRQEKRSTSMFTYLLHGLARAYTTNITDALCIGLGVGIVPMQLAAEGARVDVVEINPAVVPLAEKFFDLKPEKLNLTIGDGRFFLNQCRQHYDAVILDAFLGDSSPSHLMSREAFTAIRRVLKPGGVLVINSFGDFEPGRDFFTASLHKTLKTVFPGVRIHARPGGGNVLFVATDTPEPRFLHAPNVDSVHPSVRWATESAFANVMDTHPDHGRLLTDDFNPVEFFDAKNREANRRSLAMSMKSFGKTEDEDGL
ncbi:MAG: fused MFS/spermidine synthase [Verrucomicrobia bacterium]|nr:fused MFS/spermidine synthase [Verrucomicrobiota bacterium]